MIINHIKPEASTIDTTPIERRQRSGGHNMALANESTSADATTRLESSLKFRGGGSSELTDGEYFVVEVRMSATAGLL